MNNKIKIDISYDDVFRDPVEKFYKKIEPNIPTYIEQFVQDRLKAVDPSIDAQTQLLLKKMNACQSDIEKRAKNMNVNGLKFANTLIFILFFLIIGFAFWKIYKKNKAKIAEFENFEQNKTQEMNKYRAQKAQLLIKLFNSYSIRDVKNSVFAKIGLNAVHNDDFDEILNSVGFSEKNPVYFKNIDKYDVRNNYFYDVYYLRLAYQPVMYTGSRTVSYAYKGKTYWKTVTANYSHITPFLKPRQLFLYPSNYLPNLQFRSLMPLSKKEIKKYEKQNLLILDNIEMYSRYNFSYSNELDFVNFFQLNTQNNYIKWYDFANKEGVYNGTFEKTKHSFLIYNDSVGDSSYKTNNDILLQNIYNDFSSTVQSITNLLKDILTAHIRNAIANLTLTFSNKYLASEKHTKTGNAFSFEYKDDASYTKFSTDTHSSLFLTTKLYSDNYLNLYSHRPSRDKLYKIQDTYDIDGVKIMNVVASSWYIEKKVKTVIVSDFNAGNVPVEVPYDDYINYSEIKQVIYSKNYKLGEGQVINSYLKDKDYKLSTYETDDDNLKGIISQFRFFWNYLLGEDKQTNDDTIDYIKVFNVRFKDYKNFYSIEIDQNGTYVFIDKPEKIPNDIKIKMAKTLK